MSKRGGKRGVDDGASVEEASVVVGVAAAAAVTAEGVAAVAAKEARVELWRRDEVVGLTASLFEKVEPFCIKKAELSVISVSKIVGGKGTFYPARCVDIHSRELATMYLNEKQVAVVGLSNGMRVDVEDAYATVSSSSPSLRFALPHILASASTHATSSTSPSLRGMTATVCSTAPSGPRSGSSILISSSRPS